MFCILFGYSKQAYYKQCKNQQRKTSDQQQLKQSVLQIRQQLPRLGTRKLHYLLKGKHPIGRDRLFALLREEGLLVSRRKKYTRTTDSSGWMRQYPNLVKDMVPSRPEQLWVADITYMDTLDGTVYLHLITDAYSKRIMGYEVSENLRATSTCKAFAMAIANRQYQALIHHSDRGLQYSSKDYTDMAVGIRISMTETGSPYDNAVAERVNGILKEEFGLAQKLDDLQQAKHYVRQSIALYNSFRPHLSCEMLTPDQMHAQQQVKIKTYKRTPSITTDS